MTRSTEPEAEAELAAFALIEKLSEIADAHNALVQRVEYLEQELSLLKNGNMNGGES